MADAGAISRERIRANAKARDNVFIVFFMVVTTFHNLRDYSSIFAWFCGGTDMLFAWVYHLSYCQNIVFRQTVLSAEKISTPSKTPFLVTTATQRTL